MPYSLRLIEDTLAPGARYSPALGSAAGVLYLAGGEMRVADGAALLEPFPQAITPTKAIAIITRMTVSVTRTGFPLGRVEYRIRSTILPERMSHRNAGTASPVHFETPGLCSAHSGSVLREG